MSETALFADWCASWGIEPLGVDADTLLRFLDECPAAPATLARRVRAVDAWHERAGRPPPGRDPRVRRYLRAAAGRPVEPQPRGSAETVRAALAAVPVFGWPAALAGRRDAAVLALTCLGGLTRRQVTGLRLGSLTADPIAGVVRGIREADADVVGELSNPGVELPRAESPAWCPACAYTRWFRLAVVGHTTNWRGVREWLVEDVHAVAGHVGDHDCATALPSLPSGPGDVADRPLFTGFDRHGWPLRQPLSPRSVTAIIAARIAAGSPDILGRVRPVADELGATPAGRELYTAMEALLDEFEARLADADHVLRDVLAELERSAQALRAPDTAS